MPAGREWKAMKIKPALVSAVRNIVGASFSDTPESAKAG
jgi:hypothetical protein